MKLRVFFLLIAFFLVISPLAQAFGQCSVMSDGMSMAMIRGVACQDHEQVDICDSGDSTDTPLSNEDGCFSGNLCAPHFYAIQANSDIGKPLFVIPLLLAMPVRVERLKQTVSPEIKPPICNA